MYLLDHRYEIREHDNVMIVSDSVQNKVEFAFKSQAVDDYKLKRLLYFGTPINKSISSLEERMTHNIVKKYNNYFINCNEERTYRSFKLIREYTELLRAEFLSRDHFNQYIQDIQPFIHGDKIVRIILDINGYNYLAEMLDKHPFLDMTIMAGNQVPIDQATYDFVITEPSGEDKDYLWQSFAESVLFLKTNQDKIAIGPLIYTDEFHIPKFDTVNSHDKPIILHQEERLLYFFIERILYSHIFGLNSKLNKDCCIPTRHSLVISRLDLQGYSEAVTIFPKTPTLMGANK